VNEPFTLNVLSSKRLTFSPGLLSAAIERKREREVQRSMTECSLSSERSMKV